MKTMLLAAALAVTGCAAERPTTWLKADATQQQFALDAYNCQKDARAAGPYTEDLLHMPGAKSGAEQFFELCMSAHGYAQKAAQ